ncbi:MAG: HEAT repeat domain-containing protein [Anaerolineae bacterium]|nr:HEAT repeat domain-containing protein [Anaerolineae bacterium]
MPLDPNAVPGLLRALDSADVYVRITAAEALGKIGNPVAIARLTDTLDDARPDVRRRVIGALLRIGTEPKARAAAQVVPGLARGLEDADPSGALGGGGSPASPRYLQRAGGTRPLARSWAMISAAERSSQRSLPGE